MSGPPECASDLGHEGQEGDLGESVNEQLPPTGDAPAHVPGSDSLFGEGKLRFPPSLLEQGGCGILVNPMGEGCHEYLLSASVFDLTTSIEGVMLFILERALNNTEANWPALLNNYNWFPRGLSKVGAAKRLARWQYIMSKEPEDPDSCSVTTRHSFWLQGYSENKLND